MHFPESLRKQFLSHCWGNVTSIQTTQDCIDPSPTSVFCQRSLRRLSMPDCEHTTTDISYCILSSLQSAYRQYRSTETAVVYLHNDMIRIIDRGCISILTLLDISAAFDTVDHSTFMEVLWWRFGISDGALAWMADGIVGAKSSVLQTVTPVTCPSDMEFFRDPFSVQGSLSSTLRMCRTSLKGTRWYVMLE